MLVLTRKTKQQIHIGPNITITILHVKGQAVRVGIEAPRDVSVLRSEIADRSGEQHDRSDRNRPSVAPSAKVSHAESNESIGQTQPNRRLGDLVRCRVSRATALNPATLDGTGAASALNVVRSLTGGQILPAPQMLPTT